MVNQTLLPRRKLTNLYDTGEGRKPGGLRAPGYPHCLPGEWKWLSFKTGKRVGLRRVYLGSPGMLCSIGKGEVIPDTFEIVAIHQSKGCALR